MDQPVSTQSVRGQDEQKLYDELRNAVWVLRVKKESHVGMGTGFCIDSNGLIMTCAHCVRGSSHVQVARQNDKKFQKAFVLHKIDAWDIAILCLEKELTKRGNFPNEYPLMQLAKDGTLTPGQDVYAVSHQHKLMYSFSSGKISYPCKDEVKSFDKLPSGSSEEKQVAKDVLTITSEYRTVKETNFSGEVKNGDLPVIEINNIHLSHGGSGGPIIILTGDVVGMLCSGILSTCYAVHVSALRIAFEEAKKKYTKLVKQYAAKLEEQVQKSGSNSKEN